MNVLDENIITPERERLRAWRVHFRRIGVEVGRFGIDDREKIIPLLHSLRRPTFFTGIPHVRLHATKDENEVAQVSNLRHTLFSEEIKASIIPSCATMDIVWFTSMLILMKPPTLSAASYATRPFALRLSAWARWFGFVTAA